MDFEHDHVTTANYGPASPTVSAIGSTTCDYLEHLRAMEGAVVKCETAAKSWLPDDLQAFVTEQYCLCVTLPADVGPGLKLFASDEVDIYNQVNHEWQICDVVLLVGNGNVALNGDMIREFLTEIKTQFPILFLFEGNWAFIGYAWDKATEDEDLAVQFFRAHNYRYIPGEEHEEQDAAWQEARKLEPGYVEPVAPDGYVTFRANRGWRTAHDS